MQQASTVTSEQNWQKMESALVSAIMGRAVEEEERPSVRPMEPPERPIRPSLQPRPPSPATQADIHHLDKMVAVLRDELEIHRTEVQRLHTLMRRGADGEPRYDRQQSDAWWRRLLLRPS